MYGKIVDSKKIVLIPKIAKLFFFQVVRQLMINDSEKLLIKKLFDNGEKIWGIQNSRDFKENPRILTNSQWD